MQRDRSRLQPAGLQGGQFGGMGGVLLGMNLIEVDVVGYYGPPLWTAPLIAIGGVLLFFVMMHVARGLGRMHGHIAKHFLVKAG